MNRRHRPLLGAAAVAVSLSVLIGCTGQSDPILLGEGYSEAPASLPKLWVPPTAQGGGPPSCHDPDDLDLEDPEEPPDGFESPDDSAASPAHPPHLRKKGGFEENI